MCPATFKSCDSRVPEFKGKKFSLQVAAEDCTGCTICVEVCPAKNKSRGQAQGHQHASAGAIARGGARQLEFLPRAAGNSTGARSRSTALRQQQLLQPLFEFSGACAGCGETPYIKMLTQLFGDRMVVAQRDGLLLDLRRQFADDALCHEQVRPRPDVVQLAVRGQRGIRSRLPRLD